MKGPIISVFFMPAKDKPVDAYIAKSADFAKPILKHLRAPGHEPCPQAVEALHWGFPHFTHQGLMCQMAALRKNKKALAAFEAYSYSHKKAAVGAELNSGKCLPELGQRPLMACGQPGQRQCRQTGQSGQESGPPYPT